MLSEAQITQFQTLYQNRFGKVISREEACTEGIRLIRLVELICKPANEEEYQRLQQLCEKTKS